VQDPDLMDELHRREHLLQHRHDLIRREGLIGRVENIVQVAPVDVVDGHVGGVVVLKHLMHADDVGMHQPCQAFRLGQETVDETAQVALVLARPGAHQSRRAAAECVREAFLDHDGPVEAVLGQIGDPEAAGIEKALDGIVPAKKLGPGLQVIGKGIGIDPAKFGLELRTYLRRTLRHVTFLTGLVTHHIQRAARSRNAPLSLHKLSPR
jgi:hypothetical protein